MKVLMWEHFAPGGPIRVGGHHLAERFLRRGDEVAWCVGPVSPINVIRSSDETDARMRLWRRRGAFSHGGRMFAYAPMTLLPWRRHPLLDSKAVARRTLRATVPRLERVLGRAGFKDVDLLFMEPGAPLLALLDAVPHRRAVYRMCDRTAAFPDTPRSFAAMEGEVCRSVDLVVATARCLERRATELGARRLLYLPNACDPEPFGCRDLSEPPEVAGLPRPRAVYAGGIDSWFDTALLLAVARRLPEWSFVLIGPARRDRAALAACHNVRTLGPRPYEQLPAYLAAADAGIVPFRVTTMTDAIHPIKVYEYCAAGLPVVSTPMQETLAMGAPIAFAADAAGFAAALQRERSADGPAPRADRAAFARRHTWDARFASLLGALDDLEDEAAGQRAASGGAR